MIKPQKNILIFSFFSWYISYIIKKDFNLFTYNQVEFNKEKSILLLANHYSWWDGFFMFHLNKLFFKKHFHVMILEETAKKQWFLRSLGGFGVQKNSRSVLESLDFAVDLLNNPQNLVLIFPQGEILPVNVKEITFESGVKKIFERTKGKIQLIFSVTFIRYFTKRRPSVWSQLLNWQYAEKDDFISLKTAFNNHYQHAIIEQEKQGTE